MPQYYVFLTDARHLIVCVNHAFGQLWGKFIVDLLLLLAVNSLMYLVMVVSVEMDVHRRFARPYV